MERKRKVLMSAGLTVALAAIAVTVACSDATVEPNRALPTDASTAISGRRAERRALSRAELRQRNQLDWVGGAHNQLLDVAIAELNKPGVGLKNLCSRLQAVLADRRSWGRHADRVSAASAADIAASLRESALCNDDRRREISRTPRRQGRHASMSQGNTVSAQAEFLYHDVIASTEQAESLEDLDAALSNIAQDAAHMTGNDSILVNGAIAVAQATSEYWSNPNVWVPLVSAIENDLAQCQAGNSEGMMLEADGATYMCSGSEWRQVSAPPRPNSPIVQLASYQGGNAFTLAGAQYPGHLGWPDPCAFRVSWVGGWDVKAFGAVVPFLATMKTRGLIGAVGIATGGSLTAALIEAIRHVMCRIR